jgi:hypothetical protein
MLKAAKVIALAAVGVTAVAMGDVGAFVTGALSMGCAMWWFDSATRRLEAS